MAESERGDLLAAADEERIAADHQSAARIRVRLAKASSRSASLAACRTGSCSPMERAAACRAVRSASREDWSD